MRSAGASPGSMAASVMVGLQLGFEAKGCDHFFHMVEALLLDEAGHLTQYGASVVVKGVVHGKFHPLQQGSARGCVGHGERGSLSQDSPKPARIKRKWLVLVPVIKPHTFLLTFPKISLLSSVRAFLRAPYAPGNARSTTRCCSFCPAALLLAGRAMEGKLSEFPINAVYRDSE